jgi:S1-C subfamily serine protease
MRSSVRVSLCLIGLAALAAAEDSPARQRRRSPVVDVFEQCRDAVVNINTTRIQRVRMPRRGFLFDDIFDFGLPTVREQRVQSVGSGAIIHENGYVVTNAPVCEAGPKRRHHGG